MLCAAFAALALLVVAPLHPTAATDESLWTRVEAVRDDTGALTPETIRDPALMWQPSSDLGDEFTATRLRPSITWFRMRIRPAGAGEYDVLVSWHALDAELVVPKSDGSFTIVRTGGDVATSRKPFDNAQNVIPLPRDALDGRMIYLRVTSPFEHDAVFALKSERVWLGGLVDDASTRGLVLLLAGFIAAFGILNILLALRLRREAYTYYAAAVLAAALHMLVITGDAWRWLWPDIAIDYDVADIVSYTLAIAFAVVFGRSFLATRKTFPRTDAAIIALLVLFIATNALLVVAPELLVGWNLWDVAEIATTALVLAPLAVCGALAAGTGNGEALLYCLAVLGIMVGNVIGGAANTMLVQPYTTILRLAPTLGFAWEALLLSLALAERLRSFEHDAFFDPLTRLSNRRGLDRAMESEFGIAARTHAPYSVLVLDVDRFKAFNDRYGHVAGDGALQGVAAALGGALRAIDCAARYGGEEFVALLPATDLPGALVLGERVREAVRALAIPHADGVDGILTVSVGAACARQGEAAEALLERADTALYWAKRSGRDRVEAAA